MRVLMLSLASTVTLIAVTTAQNDPSQGKASYERVCAACHGQNAQGDGGPSLVPMTMDYEEFLARVRQGGGEMPQISKSTITDEQVKEVLEYLKSLSAPTPHAAGASTEVARFARRDDRQPR
jgi:mono/diheme cytochrome c family protein